MAQVHKKKSRSKRSVRGAVARNPTIRLTQIRKGSQIHKIAQSFREGKTFGRNTTTTACAGSDSRRSFGPTNIQTESAAQCIYKMDSMQMVCRMQFRMRRKLTATVASAADSQNWCVGHRTEGRE